MLHGVVLRALPYPNDDRIVLFHSENPGLGIARDGFTGAEAVEGLAEVPGFEETAYFDDSVPRYTFTGGGAPQRVGVVQVSAHFFSVFDMPAALGRTFNAADFDERRPVAVLSHTAWLELTGGDSTTVGRTLRFEEAAVEVVGVLPASFQEPAGGPTIRPCSKCRS